ncbi:hypothetical protein [Phytohabitans rumicis]|uniref:Uncharacterized protein n=1 Tax=Phytohabitans rumicis TaxID=1076125 RepID=A0A6V8LAJ0_9ACTN|nr:hypothetical protein [Phytohabitans rumicis]GFJ91569.1 hypothetical protein Prum_052110 [Phytohabitans rumicis]
MNSTVVVNLVAIDCCSCGVVFGLSEGHHRQLRRTGQRFFCPNGHSQSYTETEADRLRKQLATVEQQRDRARANATHYQDQAEATERVLRATRGQVTKLKKRVANGVCPCCNRSFANLARHMAGQHPDYAGDDDPSTTTSLPVGSA